MAEPREHGALDREQRMATPYRPRVAGNSRDVMAVDQALLEHVTCHRREGQAGTLQPVDVGGRRTERTLAIADVVQEIATEAERTPAQVALAWTLRNPDVTTPVIGARTPEQLEGNLNALEVDLTTDQLARLDNASAIDLGHPHNILASDHLRTATTGNLKIQTRR